MKSIRLNKTIRESIVSNILKAWDKANPEPQVCDSPSRKVLVDALYKQWRDENSIDTLIACGMKEDYLNKGSYVYVEVLDKETGAKVLSDGHHFTNDKDERESRIFKSGGGLSCTNDHPIYLEWKAQRDEYTKQHQVLKQHLTKRSDYACDIRAVLDSVNTTKQLVEAWPEVEQYIPNTFRDPSSVQLPAILPTLPKGE